MKIFLLGRTDLDCLKPVNPKLYCTQLIVAAKNEIDAREIHPLAKRKNDLEYPNLLWGGPNNPWVRNPSSVTAKHKVSFFRLNNFHRCNSRTKLLLHIAHIALLIPHGLLRGI